MIFLCLLYSRKAISQTAGFSDTAGNQTVHAYDIVQFLNQSNFDLFIDPFNEQHLYFGKHGDKVLEIDEMFGSGNSN